MAKRITSVNLPTTTQGGDELDVTIEYTADQDGELAITYLGSFDGSPPSVPLSAAGTRAQFKMTIVRYGAAPECQVELAFGNSVARLVEVT